MICFLGKSFVAKAMAKAARCHGIAVGHYTARADLLFVSIEPKTDKKGRRSVYPIRHAIRLLRCITSKPIVVTSQVDPGFMRSLNIPQIWHQVELLRAKDAMERAMNPEQIIVGGPKRLPPAYKEYLAAFDCPILQMSWESAEFSKVAINTFLAAQVDHTNRLAKAAKHCNAKWPDVVQALKNDKRIGAHAYLRPGRWQDSLHILRDVVTLESL